MSKKIVFLFLGGFFAIFAPVYGSPDLRKQESLFAQGNSEYQSRNFAAAERYYRQVLSSGVESGPLYYNLGNACFKQKKLGEAIYYWEKASQKMPADREIRGNIELANLLIVDRIETPAKPLPLRILSSAQNVLTAREQGWIVVALFILGNLLFTSSLLTKDSRKAHYSLIGSIVAVCFLILFGCSLWWKIHERDYRQHGIVVEQSIDVRSGPGQENITVFTIHEGMKIRVHESSNGWYQISLANGWSGWLPKNCIRIL